MSRSDTPANVGSMEWLGRLPESAQTSFVTDSVMRRIEVRSYTSNQMRAYAAQAVAVEREACALACEAEKVAQDIHPSQHDESDQAYNTALEHAAQAIRLRSNVLVSRQGGADHD